MTSSEYKNTIEWTLKHSDENSDPEKVQRILRNLGTPFPQNDGNSTETIISLLSSGDYMGWNPCSKDQARFCVNNGYPAVAIYNNTVVILLPDDESVKISSTVPKSTSKLVRKVTELNDIKADQIRFFAYATLLDNHDTADRNSNENDNMIAAYATKTTCTSSCQSSCQSTCQTSCQSCNTCQSTCESKCQSACQSSCQSCNTCQSNCQISCQSCNTCQTTCQTSCQTACESKCQTSCESSCQSACQSSCQTCNTCQSTCQTSCQSCNVCDNCQSGCQISCQTCNTCQTTCETTCQTTCQATCQTTCQATCQTTCQVSCQTCDTCQKTCEVSCQTCDSCQTTCETICQTCNSCQNVCESICQSGQDTCQTCDSCQTTCETICQTTCQANCQTACQSICQIYDTCDTCQTCEADQIQFDSPEGNTVLKDTANPGIHIKASSKTYKNLDAVINGTVDKRFTGGKIDYTYYIVDSDNQSSAANAIMRLPADRRTFSIYIAGHDNSRKTVYSETREVSLDSGDTVYYTITYDYRDGTGSRKFDTVEQSKSATLPSPIRKGYLLKGWFIGVSNGTMVGDGGSKYTPTNSVKLYARWTDKYTITYKTNGGEINATSDKVKIGESISLRTPTRTGFTFDGWYTNEDLTGSPVGSLYTPSSNVTLYAKWKSDGSKITLPYIINQKYGFSYNGQSINLEGKCAGVCAMDISMYYQNVIFSGTESEIEAQLAKEIWNLYYGIKSDGSSDPMFNSAGYILWGNVNGVSFDIGHRDANITDFDTIFNLAIESITKQSPMMIHCYLDPNYHQTHEGKTHWVIPVAVTPGERTTSSLIVADPNTDDHLDHYINDLCTLEASIRRNVSGANTVYYGYVKSSKK